MSECKTVTLRTRPLKKGMLSFYLDYYPGYRDQETMKTIRHEGLNIYIYANPKNQRERDFNAAMSEKAEAIRCRRFEAIVNERYDFFDKRKYKADFLEYYRKQLRKHDQKWGFVYQHFYNFVHGKCTFEEIDVGLCNKFREYLLNAKQLRRDGQISKNSASGYWSTFRGFLKILYRNRMIKTNVNDFLEKIEWKEVKKEYLTLDEVKKLAATPCKIPVLKQASLFACMTGLRISDILKLDWRDFEVGPDQGYYIRICTEKTETEATLPISQEALELCGEWGTGKVFKGLTRSMTHHPLKQWIAEAGIRKHITFHCFRHSYAVIQISLGTDIYTVSKMLTHKNVSTTQIYADLVNSKKRETANKISLK